MMVLNFGQYYFWRMFVCYNDRNTIGNVWVGMRDVKRFVVYRIFLYNEDRFCLDVKGVLWRNIVVEKVQFRGEGLYFLAF